MLTVWPVEAFLCHAESDDDVHRVPVLARHRAQICERFPSLQYVAIVDEVGNPQNLAVVVASNPDDAGLLLADHSADRIQNVPDFLDLVLRGFAAVNVRNMDKGFLVEVQNFVNRRRVSPLVEVMPDAQRLQVLVSIQLVVVVERDRGELLFVFR